jgi:hypothetical protein
MVPTSRWFEALSTDEDTMRIRDHLNKLIEAMIATAALRAAREDTGTRIPTVPDVEHPDDPANSL